MQWIGWNTRGDRSAVLLATLGLLVATDVLFGGCLATLLAATLPQTLQLLCKLALVIGAHVA